MNQQHPADTLLLPVSGGIDVIPVDMLVRVEASSNYSWLHLNNGDKIIASRTLQWFEKVLAEKSFIRVHRTHLVNTSFIRRYHKHHGGRLLLLNGEEIDISRRKRSHFLQNWLSGMAS